MVEGFKNEELADGIGEGVLKKRGKEMGIGGEEGEGGEDGREGGREERGKEEEKGEGEDGGEEREREHHLLACEGRICGEEGVLG